MTQPLTIGDARSDNLVGTIAAHFTTSTEIREALAIAGFGEINSDEAIAMALHAVYVLADIRATAQAEQQRQDAALRADIESRT